MKKVDKLSEREKLVKLFESVGRAKMDRFKEYLNSKPLNESLDELASMTNENPQRPEPEVAPPPAPQVQPEVLPRPTTTPTPAPKPNPFAPSIEPDTEPKAEGVSEEEQTKPIDLLAKKLSDEIAATYNKNKGNIQSSSPETPQQA